MLSSNPPSPSFPVPRHPKAIVPDVDHCRAFCSPFSSRSFHCRPHWKNCTCNHLQHPDYFDYFSFKVKPRRANIPLSMQRAPSSYISCQINISISISISISRLPCHVISHHIIIIHIIWPDLIWSVRQRISLSYQYHSYQYHSYDIIAYHIISVSFISYSSNILTPYHSYHITSHGSNIIHHNQRPSLLPSVTLNAQIKIKMVMVMIMLMVHAVDPIYFPFISGAAVNAFVSPCHLVLSSSLSLLCRVSYAPLPCTFSRASLPSSRCLSFASFRSLPSLSVLHSRTFACQSAIHSFRVRSSPKCHALFNSHFRSFQMATTDWLTDSQ